jgi:hypothetical protein
MTFLAGYVESQLQSWLLENRIPRSGSGLGRVTETLSQKQEMQAKGPPWNKTQVIKVLA